MREYRIINADYAIVGHEAEIGALARGLADEMAHRGIRLGVLTAQQGTVDLPEETVDLFLSPVVALAVVELTDDHLSDAIQDRLHTRRPLYRVTHEGALTAEGLRRAVERMLSYGEPHLHLAAA